MRSLWLCCLLGLIGIGMAYAGYMHRRQDVHNATLIDATARNDLPKLQELLAQGADPNAKWQEEPPFTWPNYGRQMVGIDPRASANGHTALMLAALEGKLPLARALLDGHADVNIRDGKGQTALHWAARSKARDSGSMILLLAQHGADLKAKTADGKTAKDIARGNPRALQALWQAAAKK